MMTGIGVTRSKSQLSRSSGLGAVYHATEEVHILNEGEGA